jgi:integrase
MAAITDEREFGHLMIAIDESTGWWSVKAYLKFLAITFVRPGEARLARWTEIDIKGAIWNIPADRMKMRRPHDVPLSRQALGILALVRRADPDSPLVFPSLRSNRKPLSDNAANSALRKMGFSREQMVSHGFRSSASTILNRRRFDREVIEMQLAHAPNDRIRAIYNRDQMWSDRVRLMQRWADLIDDMQML